jgi:hypothetical protein
MADAGALAAIASIISAFGVAFFFRLQRELKMQEVGDINWIPWSDWLLVGATAISLLFFLLPMLAACSANSAFANFATASAASACVLVAGHIPSILAQLDCR